MQVDPLPPGLERLDPRAIPYARLARFVRIAIEALLILVLATGAFADDWLTPTFCLVLLGVALVGVAAEIAAAFVMPSLTHRHTGYRVDALGLEIRTGVFWRSVVTVARSRIQHLDVTQGPLERRYGLGRLHVHTAGTADASIVLHGLAYEMAKAIRDNLGMWGSAADGV